MLCVLDTKYKKLIHAKNIVSVRLLALHVPSETIEIIRIKFCIVDSTLN
jgi:hypothetical protein